MKQFQELNLSNNKICDISNLPYYKNNWSADFNFSNNEITDISCINNWHICKSTIPIGWQSGGDPNSRGMSFDFSGNKITDISCVKDWITLKYLNLSNNLIEDISSLAQYNFVVNPEIDIYDNEEDLYEDLENFDGINLSENYIDLSTAENILAINTFNEKNVSLIVDNQKEIIDLEKATVSEITVQEYTGKEIKPEIEVKLAGKTLTKDTDYTILYENNINIGTAKITITGNGNYVGTKSTTFEIKVYNVLTYRTHVQDVGWQDYVSDGEVSGTEGSSLRLEGINIVIPNQEYSGDIEYQTHIQNIGWESNWKKNGEMSGTSGQALRLEAIRIKLTGEMVEHYDIYYRVHAQNFGWLDWAKN